MSGTVEQKMLQAIMFVFETSVTAISGLFDYCVFKKCKVDDLEGFLNKFEFKHTLFHLYNNDVTCCECETRFQGRNQVLKKVDFETLYKYVGRSHPHIKRNEKGTITQVCICDFEAKPGITLNDLDITLMAKILRNSCMKLVHPAALTGVDEIKERRNRICHAGRLDSLKDGDVDKMLQELETYVLQVIQQIQHKSFQTSIKTQIRLLKSSTIQHEEALIIIKQTECIVAAEKLILIGIIEGNTKQLGNKMESLHEQSLQCYQKGTEDLKKKSDDIKQEFKDNQEIVTSTQKEHTVKLDKIEHISEDVLQTTTETKHEQLKQTSIIATIQKSVEQLKANDLNEEDKEGLKKLKDSFAKIKNLTGILDGCDVECQTDTECMQFELGENSKAVLRVQNDHMEEKLEKIMNSLDRIHGQYETIASSKATAVLSGNENIHAKIKSVLEIFLRKIIQSKDDINKLKVETVCDFTEKTDYVLEWMVSQISPTKGCIEEAKKQLEILKDHIKRCMETLESLINECMQATISDESSYILQRTTQSKLDEIKKLVCQIYGQLTIANTFTSTKTTNRFIKNMQSYFEYFRKCIQFDETDAQSTGIISISRENVANIACNCFIDLFVCSIVLDFHNL